MKIIKLKEKDLNNIIKKVLWESSNQNIEGQYVDGGNIKNYGVQWEFAKDVAEEVQAWWEKHDDRYGFFKEFNHWYKFDDDKGAAKAYRNFVNKKYLPRLKDNYWLYKFEEWFDKIVDEIDDVKNDKCYMTLEPPSVVDVKDNWAVTYTVDPEIDWW